MVTAKSNTHVTRLKSEHSNHTVLALTYGIYLSRIADNIGNEFTDAMLRYYTFFVPSSFSPFPDFILMYLPPLILSSFCFSALIGMSY